MQEFFYYQALIVEDKHVCAKLLVLSPMRVVAAFANFFEAHFAHFHSVHSSGCMVAAVVKKKCESFMEETQ